MIIPGFIVSLITFPGVILHEWAHKYFCEKMGVKVLKVKYFQLETPAGYVLHEAPSSYAQTFWISIGPLLVNSFAAIILGFTARYFLSIPGLGFIFNWLALSVGAHAFPSTQDASHILNASRRLLSNGGSLIHYGVYPFFGLIFVANLLRFFWIDFIYALGLTYTGFCLAEMLI